MPELTSIIIGFAIAFALAVVTTPVVIYLTNRAGFVAKPRKDRWHKVPVALMGGVAIYVSFVIPLVILQNWTISAIFFIAGCTIMFATGLIDDIMSIKPYSKLLAQIVASSVVMFGGFVLNLPGIPLLSSALTLLWIVGIVNAFNLLDNMDGLSAGTAGISAFFLTLISIVSGDGATALSGAILLGSAVGFLFYNFNPARIFMGDCGSLFLGFAMATLSIQGHWQHSANLLLTLLTPALLLAVPIFDTTFVTAVRLLHGRSIAQGGRDHTSHRLVAFGLSERKTSILFYAMSFSCGCVAFLGVLYNAAIPAITAALIVVGLFYFGIFLNGIIEYRDTATLKSSAQNMRHAIDVLMMYKKRIVEVITDTVLIGLSFVAAFLVRFDGVLVPQYVDLISRSLPIILPIKLMVFFALGLYRPVWRYVSIRDLFTIIKSITVGSLLSVAAVVMLYRFEGYPRSVFIIDWMILLITVGGVRGLTRAIGEYLGSLSENKGRRILILGAGDAGELLLREIRQNDQLDYVPCGFIDDDPIKAGASIHGLPILGGRKALKKVIAQHRIDEVLIAIPSVESKVLQDIVQDCSHAGVPVQIVGSSLRNKNQDPPSKVFTVGAGNA